MAKERGLQSTQIQTQHKIRYVIPFFFFYLCDFKQDGVQHSHDAIKEES